jgi:hypothetical protein
MRPLLQITPVGKVPIHKPQFFGFERGIDGSIPKPKMIAATSLEQIACKRYDWQNSIPLVPIHDRFEKPDAEFGGYTNGGMRNTNRNPRKEYPILSSSVY